MTDPKPLKPIPKKFISKADLIPGAYYAGICRNAQIARWDGEMFIHWRRKFSSVFLESIKHPDDEPFFDVFQPLLHIHDSELIKGIPLD